MGPPSPNDSPEKKGGGGMRNGGRAQERDKKREKKEHNVRRFVWSHNHGGPIHSQIFFLNKNEKKNYSKIL